MNKLDYFAKYTWSNPDLPYDMHWWYNKTTDYHCHTDFYELFLTIDDGIVQTYNGVREPLTKQIVYLIPLHQYHKLDFVRAENHISLFNLSLSTPFFSSVAELYSPLLVEKMRGKDLITIPLSDTEYAFLLDLSNKLTYIAEENRRRLLVRLYLAAVSCFFDIKFRNTAGLSQAELFAADLKARIDNLEFLEKNLAEAYKLYPVSPSILIRAFKRLTGMTIVGYHVARKMSYAASLLASTDFSILQIAFDVGYDSVSHFISSFKRYMGLTPSEYRKKNNNPIFVESSTKSDTHKSSENK